jgi:hypothetical protein
LLIGILCLHTLLLPLLQLLIVAVLVVLLPHGQLFFTGGNTELLAAAAAVGAQHASAAAAALRFAPQPPALPLPLSLLSLLLWPLAVVLPLAEELPCEEDDELPPLSQLLLFAAAAAAAAVSHSSQPLRAVVKLPLLRETRCCLLALDASLELALRASLLLEQSVSVGFSSSPSLPPLPWLMLSLKPSICIK